MSTQLSNFLALKVSSESFLPLYTDGFASNTKKAEPTMNNVDSDALLKQIALADVLDGWKDGILTIGTLGCDPFNSSFNQQKEYIALENEHELHHHEGEGEHIFVDGDDEEKVYNVEHEELNPLIHTTFEQIYDYEDVFDPNHDAINENFLNSAMVSCEITELCHEETDQRKKKGERITLADLFLADSDVKMIKLDPAKVLLEPNEKKSLKIKHGLSLAKKLFPLVKDNSHPVKNLQRVSR